MLIFRKGCKCCLGGNKEITPRIMDKITHPSEIVNHAGIYSNMETRMKMPMQLFAGQRQQPYNPVSQTGVVNTVLDNYLRNLSQRNTETSPGMSCREHKEEEEDGQINHLMQNDFQKHKLIQGLSRRRCAECYKKLSLKFGSLIARNKATKSRKFCKDCCKPLCAPCFKNIH